MERTLRILSIRDYTSNQDLPGDLLVAGEDEIQITETVTFEELKHMLESNTYDGILADLEAFGFAELGAIKKVKTQHPHLPVIIVARLGSEAAAVEAMKRGTADCLVRSPQSVKQLPHIIKTAVRSHHISEADQLANKYDLIVSTTKDLMTLINRHYVYEAVNEAYCAAHNLTREEIIGRTVADICGATVSHDSIEENLDRCFAGDEVNYQTWFEFGVLGFRYFDVSYYPRCDKWGVITHAVVISHDMTEQERAREILRESEEKYRTILASIEEGYFETDLSGNLTFFNKALCRMSGYSHDELIGMNNREYTTPETAQIMLRIFHKIYQTGKTAEINDYEVIRKDGSKRIYELSASLIKGADGMPVGFRGVARDATDRREAEKALQEFQKDLAARNKSLEAINTIADTLYRSLDYRTVVEKAVESMMHYSQSPSVAIFAYEESSKSLELLHARGFSEKSLREELARVSLPLEKSLTGMAIDRKGIVATDDSFSGGFSVSDASDGEDKSTVSVPLLFQDRVLGVMNLVFKGRWTLTDYERETLISIGKTVGLALANARHVAQVEAEMAERRRAEEKIKEYSMNLENMVEERTKELNRALFDMGEARDRIDGIIKSVADGLIVTDMYHRIILMNRAAEDLLGVRFSESINRSIDAAVRDKTLLEQIKYAVGKKGAAHQFDFELSGEVERHPRIMRARTSMMEDRHGKSTGIIIIIHDVTYECELDRIKTEFISTAAHELRTPLTSVQGFSELLMTRDNIAEDERIKFTSYINRQARNLAAIISDLLDIARIESGKGFSLNKTSVDVCEIVAELLPYYEALSKKHTFAVTIPDKAITLMADREKIEQILENVFSNAIKYSPNGGVIRVTVAKAEDTCFISVEDEGMGMTPEQVDRIFDRFYRVDTTNTAVTGTGLGMSIVKYLIEAHGGTVRVESRYNKGTKVWLELPG